MPVVRTFSSKVKCALNGLSFFLLMYRLTENYSGSDLTALARDAALGPIRGRMLVKIIVMAYETVVGGK